MFKSFSILILIIPFCYCFAQEKNEVEKRIKVKDAPQEAKTWLKDAYENQRKTKWYYQTDGNEEGFEAKLKHKKHLHSVEFDTTGEVRNIEILMAEEEVNKKVMQNIHSYLKSNYNKFKISKLQIQYTGEGDDLEDIIDEDEFEDITIHYEIEFYGKSDTEDELWEGLFDAEGQLIERRKIVLKATDNLDY